MKTYFVLCGVLTAFAVQAATWTGAGDGTSWGDPANWGGTLPSAGEEVVITTAEDDLEIALGTVDREVGNLVVDGTGKLTLAGTGSLLFGNLTSSVNLDFDAPVTFKSGDNTIYDGNKVINFLKPVTAVGTKNVSFTSPNSRAIMSVNFRDTFTGAGSTILMKMGTTGSTTEGVVHFYGKVTAAKLSCCNSGYRSGWCYLHASGNEIAAVEVCYGGIALVGENALPETIPLTWNTYYRENSEKHFAYNFMGTDQVAEAVRCPETYDERNSCRYLRSLNGATTLTLKGTSDARANCAVNADMSLVWDPTGDYTQEFLRLRA